VKRAQDLIKQHADTRLQNRDDDIGDRQIIPLVPDEVAMPVPPTSISAATITSRQSDGNPHTRSKMVGAAAGRITVRRA